MKEPVDHILRPKLPWRSGDAGITECGYDATKVKTLTREEFFQRLKEYGQQRTALVTCMTCSDTARRWETWDNDPRKALEREISWECGWRRSDRGVRLRDELFAIAAIIETHPEEFAAHMAATEQRRAWLEKKETLARRPKSSTVPGL
jgi:hypothetical protein